MKNKPPYIRSKKAFTLIEIIIVISLIAFAYTVALPNMNLKKEADIANTLARLSSDVRTAFDLSILSGRPYRLAFHLMSGDYWLEESDQVNIVLSKEKLERELDRDDLELLKEEFEERFLEYESLAGEVVKDPDSDLEISPTSPVLEAKDKLARPEWRKVVSTEWGRRTLGPDLIIKDMQAEHHQSPVSLEANGEEAFAYIYFFPRGYVEKSYIHIYYRINESEADPDQDPYTFFTHPYRGEASIEAGNIEIDLDKFEN